MSSMRFPWRVVMMVIFAICGALLTFDIYTSNGLKNCRTMSLLQDAGILAFLAQVWNRVMLYTGKALIWLQENVPYYYAKASEAVGPYLQLMWEKLYEFGIYLVEVTIPLRVWLNRKVPELLEWVQAKVPWWEEQVIYYGTISWEFILHYSLWLWRHILYYSHITGTWLQENVFTGELSPENLQKHVTTSLTVVQSYTSSAYTWCSQLMAGDAATTVK